MRLPCSPLLVAVCRAAARGRASRRAGRRARPRCSRAWVGPRSRDRKALADGAGRAHGGRAHRRDQAAARLLRGRRPGRALRVEGAAAAAARRLHARATRPRSPPTSSIACSTCTWCRRSSSARSRGSIGAAVLWIEQTKGWDMNKPVQGPEPQLVAAGQPDEALRSAHRQHRPQSGQPALRRRLAPLPHRSLARLHRAHVARRHRRAGRDRSAAVAAHRGAHARPISSARSARGSSPTSGRRCSRGATACARPSTAW